MLASTTANAFETFVAFFRLSAKLAAKPDSKSHQGGQIWNQRTKIVSRANRGYIEHYQSGEKAVIRAIF